MKTCVVCHQTKPPSHFYQTSGNVCRKCRRAGTRERAASGLKLCPSCKEWKPDTEFGPNRARNDGLQVYCRPCWRTLSKGYYSTGVSHDRLVSNLYRLSRGQYAKMVEAQDERCAICGDRETAAFKGTVKRLAVDHDHATGVVRELLCSRCNTILGRADDRPELLEACAAYLRRHSNSGARQDRNK